MGFQNMLSNLKELPIEGQMKRKRDAMNQPAMIWNKNWGMQDVSHQVVEERAVWKASMATVECRKKKLYHIENTNIQNNVRDR